MSHDAILGPQGEQQAINRLQKRIRELEQENAALKAELDGIKKRYDGFPFCLECGSHIEQQYHTADCVFAERDTLRSKLDEAIVLIAVADNAYPELKFSKWLKGVK